MNKGERRGIVPTIDNEQTTAILEDELRGSTRRSKGSKAKKQCKKVKI
jgi:hypothetical protein